MHAIEFLAFRTAPKYGPTAITGESFKDVVWVKDLSSESIEKAKAEVERKHAAYVSGWRVIEPAKVDGAKLGSWSRIRPDTHQAPLYVGRQIVAIVQREATDFGNVYMVARRGEVIYRGDLLDLAIGSV